jgi:hypothetical protein
VTSNRRKPSLHEVRVMLFVAEYDLSWDMLDACVAKRIEWEEAMPDGFRFVGEYVWQDRDPPFRGVAVIEANSVEAINAFVLHYGPALRVRVFPASDVVSAIGMAAAKTAPARARRKPRRQ